MPYDTRDKVRALLNRGLPAAEVAAALGIAKSTVAYHRRMLGHAPDPRFARRYDWAEIQRHRDDGASMRDCLERFGLSRDSWYAAIRRGDLAPSVWPTPITELLVADTPRGRYNLKLRLISSGLKESRCEACGCHSQTPNFGGRKSGAYTVDGDAASTAPSAPAADTRPG
jgi:hypothetical protein